MDVDDTLTAQDVRRAVAQLRGANVPTIGGNYVGFIHPDVSYDLRGITDASGWRDSYKYTNAMPLYNGEIGMFEGVRFMESPRAPLFATLTTVLVPLVQVTHTEHSSWDNRLLPRLSQWVASMAHSQQSCTEQLQTFLQRFRPVGWKHFVGYSVFRQEALRRIESSSSIGANA
jgi:hypothetical protein